MNSFILSGRRYYEILHANFRGAFPSIRSIASKLQKYDMQLREGEIAAERLKQFLNDHNLPMVVGISEDATAVSGRREYCSKWNSIIGCSLPLLANGLPDSNEAVVKDAHDIIEKFEKFERVQSVLVVMAQPMSTNTPPLRLCSFGTNNKFSSDDTTNRLETIVSELQKHGIKVLSYAADGDSREMMSMKQLLNLGPTKSHDSGKYETIMQKIQFFTTQISFNRSYLSKRQMVVVLCQ